MKARFAARADQDVDEISDYLAQYSQPAAGLFLDELYRLADRHAGSPLIGRARDELETGLRSFVVRRKYVVLFRPADDTIEIVRVIHGARNIEAVFREEPPEPS